MSLQEFDEIKFNHTTSRLDAPSTYLLKKARRNPTLGVKNLRDSFQSSTIYIGNLSFYTSEEQIYEIFSKVGRIQKIIMGLDKFKFTPCGFCFIIFANKQDSINAIKYLNKTKLDDRILEIDLDPGFTEGRQFGRGASGGQVSDELRYDYDEGRGGYGKTVIENNIHDINFSNSSNINDIEDDSNNVRFGARRKADQYVPSSTKENFDELPENQETVATENSHDNDVEIHDASN